MEVNLTIWETERRFLSIFLILNMQDSKCLTLVKLSLMQDLMVHQILKFDEQVVKID